MRPLAKELNETFHGRGGGKPEMVQGSVQGNESEMRAWIQEKAREMNGLKFRTGEILACMWSALIVLGDSVCCPVSGRACSNDSAYRSGYGL